MVIEDTLRLGNTSIEEINSFCGRLKINELLTPDDYLKLFDQTGFKLKEKVDVSDHLAQTYHKIVKFIENNREVLENKVPEIYREKIKTSFDFDVSEKMVLDKKLGCIIFVFKKK